MNLSGRKPISGVDCEAYDFVAARKGERVAQALFRENPLAAIEGRALPYAPDANDAPAPPPKRRKRFLFF